MNSDEESGRRPPAGAKGGDEVRLNRFLAQCGLGSRRACDGLIGAGKISVNGCRVTKLGTRVDPAHDTVTCGGRRMKVVRRKEYLVYHKPRDTMVTRSDPRGRPTIYDRLRERGYRCDHLRYVGRLDRDSEGLLLLTNDGDLVHGLTHPRFHIKKVYRITLDAPLGETERNALVVSGIESRGQLLRAAEITEVGTGERGVRSCRYEVVLYQGKNRQIRRMCEGVGRSVVRLQRIRLGSVRLGKLPRGALRAVTPRELAGLKATGHRPGGKKGTAH